MNIIVKYKIFKKIQYIPAEQNLQPGFLEQKDKFMKYKQYHLHSVKNERLLVV